MLILNEQHGNHKIRQIAIRRSALEDVNATHGNHSLLCLRCDPVLAEAKSQASWDHDAPPFAA